MTVRSSSLKKNIQILRKKEPDLLADTLAAIPAGEMFATACGLANLRVTGTDGTTLPLHDEQDPNQDVLPFLSLIPADASGVVILLGLGLGYAAIRLLNERPGIRKLIIFERDLGIFHQALSAVPFAPLLNDHRVTLVIGPQKNVQETLLATAKDLQLESAFILKHLPSFSYDPSGYQQLYEEVYAFANSFNMEGATISHFGTKFLENRLQNIPVTGPHFLLEKLQDVFSGIPAILVASGPSLDKNIHLLPTLKGKAVIIAADSALPAILAQGLEPTFVSSIDPQWLTFEKYTPETFATKEISLLCMSWVTPEVAKSFPAKNVFWTYTHKPFEAWLNKQLGGSLTTGGAATVAHLNLLAAIVMGCSPIIFIGQDLAFEGTKQYAHGVALSTDSLTTNRSSANPDDIWVDGYYGEKVLTSRSFWGMKSFLKRSWRNKQTAYISMPRKEGFDWKEPSL